MHLHFHHLRCWLSILAFLGSSKYIGHSAVNDIRNHTVFATIKPVPSSIAHATSIFIVALNSICESGILSQGKFLV